MKNLVKIFIVLFFANYAYTLDEECALFVINKFTTRCSMRDTIQVNMPTATVGDFIKLVQDRFNDMTLFESGSPSFFVTYNNKGEQHIILNAELAEMYRDTLWREYVDKVGNLISMTLNVQTAFLLFNEKLLAEDCSLPVVPLNEQLGIKRARQ